MYYSNEQINQYSKPLSESEKKECESTISVFETILQKYGFSVERKNFDAYDYEDLNHRFHVKKGDLEFTIFLQGSYGNGTCVRQDSDVDVAMICESTFRCQYPHGKSGKDYGYIGSDFDIIKFKEGFCDFISKLNESYNAENHNKCIFFKGNQTSRKDMDIVPSLRYKDYTNDIYLNKNNCISGVLIKTNDGKEIINYPEQSRINSIEKNKKTAYYYKKIVRILKNIKNDMIETGVSEINSVSSYGLECLVYNVPNTIFYSWNGTRSLKDTTINVVNYLYNNKEKFDEFVETNEILKVFDNQSNRLMDYRLLVQKMKFLLEN